MVADIAHAASPNILIITADNLGYGDLRCYNADSIIRTPILDRLASQGARLTSFYTASSTCTVSRACLLTGRVAQRHGLVNQLPGVKATTESGSISKEMLIPQILKNGTDTLRDRLLWQMEYWICERIATDRTRLRRVRRTRLGQYRLLPTQLPRDARLVRGSGGTCIAKASTRRTFLPTACIDFIRRKSARQTAWFAYLPFNAPHFPMQRQQTTGTAERLASTRLGIRAVRLVAGGTGSPSTVLRGRLLRLIRAIGRVLETLDSSWRRRQHVCLLHVRQWRVHAEPKGIGCWIQLSASAAAGSPAGKAGSASRPSPAGRARIKPGTVIDEACWSPDLLVTAAAIAGCTTAAGCHLRRQRYHAMCCATARGRHTSHSSSVSAVTVPCAR